MASLNLERFPRSYRDPLYETLARTAEEKYNLPKGILDAIRTRGERSNADQVSPAGARGPYQFIPATRQGFIRQYGIDPWQDAPTQTEAAALHVRDDFKRTGSWDEAIARYNGGQRPPASSYRYAAQVGDFDGEPKMPYDPYYSPQGSSRYPVMNGVDPLAPEKPKLPVPMPGDPGPSLNAAAASPVASKKRGGILGALESVFMPDPESRWAGALRDGLFNAKESQRNYVAQELKQATDLATANAKLKSLMSKGEYQVVGNNVFHIPPDGQGQPEIITPPTTPSETERLIDRWRTMDDADPAKELIHQFLLKANDPEVLRAKGVTAETTARIRAGATTGAARIRATTAGKASAMPPLPPGFTVVK